jgi:hypothetical protein
MLHEFPRVNSDTLKWIRTLEARLLPLEAIFKSTTDIFMEMRAFTKKILTRSTHAKMDDSDIQAALDGFTREITSHKNNTAYLLQKAHSTSQSISDTISLRFQQIAQEHSDNTLRLTRSAREDSVAIRVITLVTLFYLPFSFIAVCGTRQFASWYQLISTDNHGNELVTI